MPSLNAIWSARAGGYPVESVRELALYPKRLSHKGREARATMAVQPTRILFRAMFQEAGGRRGAGNRIRCDDFSDD